MKKQFKHMTSNRFLLACRSYHTFCKRKRIVEPKKMRRGKLRTTLIGLTMGWIDIVYEDGEYLVYARTVYIPLIEALLFKDPTLN